MEKKIKEKKLTTYPDSVDTRVALLEQSIGHINQTLINLSHSVEKLDAKMDQGFRDLRQDMKSDFKWLMGMIIGLAAFTVSGFLGLGSIMAHGFHWF